MARTTSKSNPTSLIEIDRHRVTIDVTREGDARFAALTRLDCADYKLDAGLKVVLVASSNSTFCRIELGTLGNWDKTSHALAGIDPKGFLRFRVLLHPSELAQLTAVAENLVARDLENAESYLAMEPADLGEVVWKLDWSGSEPVILFNQDLFPNARGAMGYPPFGAFVLPEVVRQMLAKVIAEPEKRSDDSDPLFLFCQQLTHLGVDEWPNEDWSQTASEKWLNDIVQAFAAHFRMATNLKRELARGE